MSEFDFVEGDTGSVLSVTCQDLDGTVINLTGATVEARWVDATGAVTTEEMTVSAPLTGVATYQFGAEELVAGPLKVEVVVTDSTGKILTQLGPFHYHVRAHF